ncbi:hypothetical protein CRM22_007802 [Opisthorchis felineus]|uniref:Saposin B-type domain-containing protein n=1 Tax=Opisthorchis felineus TaxID=147828 RepID=A0A4S2LL74_OPIFE|nr:hypothetical protein CRM22_007802 [Opisthorchis felineus]
MSKHKRLFPVFLTILLVLSRCPEAEQLKTNGCISVVLGIVQKCYIQPNMPKDCSKKKNPMTFLKTIPKGRKQKTLLDALDKMCNKCKGCKPDAKVCAVTRLAVGSLKQCDLAQQLLGALGGKR